jgi:hypothetical protein
MRRLAAALVIAALPVLLDAPSAAASPIGTWSSLAETVALWTEADPEIADAFGTRYVTEANPGGEGNALSIHSLRGFRDRAPRLVDGTVVMLNLEAEPVTPRRQQRRPRRTMRRFVRTAHANGLVAVLAPSRSLVKPDPRCDDFLACGYLEIRADAFHLQAQKLECDVSAFGAFVAGAKERAASPLIVQLTIGWDDPCVTAEVVRDAWAAAVPYADGFALWGSEDRSRNMLGLEALRLIAAS